MPRNAKPRKRHTPRPIELDPMSLAHSRASLLQPQQRAALIEPIRAAFERLRTGRGDWAAWCNVADALNVSERLAEANIANDHMPALRTAQAVLAALHARHAERQSWVMRGPEIATLQHALEIHEVQLEVCTQGEMHDAIRTVLRCVAAALKGNVGPKTTVCIGALGMGGAPSLPATAAESCA